MRWRCPDSARLDALRRRWPESSEQGAWGDEKLVGRCLSALNDSQFNANSGPKGPLRRSKLPKLAAVGGTAQACTSRLMISPGSHSAKTSKGRQHTSQSVVNRCWAMVVSISNSMPWPQYGHCTSSHSCIPELATRSGVGQGNSPVGALKSGQMHNLSRNRPDLGASARNVFTCRSFDDGPYLHS